MDEKENRLKSAVSAVRQKKITIRRAATEFQVPRSTLADRLTKKYKTTVRGPSREVTDVEESALVAFMRQMANQGFPLNRAIVRSYIQEIIKTSGRPTNINLERGPSDRWFQRFLRRHPDLSERTPENMDSARLSMSNEVVIGQYFEKLERQLSENGLKDKPSQIFNCDEAGWSGKEMARAKVIAPKEGHVFRKKVATREHITAHLCVAADGKFIPTMVIFQKSIPHTRLMDIMPDNWLFAASESGYMDRDLFEKWFSRVFIPNCGPKRPVMLIMDNADPHVSLTVINMAIENSIILFSFPGHTTHILQPLDVKLIGPLKARISAMSAHASIASTSLTIGKGKFPSLLKYAINQTTPASIQSAFRATGIHPFDPMAIDRSQLVPATFLKTTNAAETSEEDTTKTCESCGSFLVNPLVKMGLVPQELANILIPPPLKPKTSKNKRVVAHARVLSTEEMRQQLEEKDVEAKKKEEGKANRLRQKEARKEQRMKEEEDKAEKRQKREDDRREKKEALELQKMERAVGGRLAQKKYTCGVCGVRGRENDEKNGVFWYGCDERMCQKWFHGECLSEGEKELLHESLEGECQWFCKRCKPWLYDEE